MGIRGELYSNRVAAEGRTYFFNVKENRMGDLFLNIVESKAGENETFERRSVVIFKDDMKVFLGALDGALKFIEKHKSPKTGGTRRFVREGMVEGEFRDLDDEYRASSDARPATRGDTTATRGASATRGDRPVARGDRRDAPQRGRPGPDRARPSTDRREARPAPRRSEGDRNPSYRSDERRPAPKRDGERRVSLVGDDRPKRTTFARKPGSGKPASGAPAPRRTPKPPAGKRIVVRKKKESGTDDFIGD